MATWYNSAYKYRKAISVDNSAGGTGTWSISLTIPEDMEDIWDHVQSDGDDIILCKADGFTPIDSGNSTAIVIDDGAGGAFNGSTKSGRIRIDQYTGGTAGSANFVWMYYGNAAATTNSAHGSWTSPSTVTARIGREGGQRVRPKILTRPEQAGATTPRVRLAKVTTETLHVFWDFSSELNLRDEPYEGSIWHEGIESAIISAESGGSPAAGLFTDTNVILMGAQGAVIRTVHPGGSDGTDYTIKLKVVTTSGRTLDRRCVLSVNDPDET